MNELIGRLKAFPLVTFEMIIASLFINILALASPIFVMLVLNRYVSHGVDSTLVSLTVGILGAIFFESRFRSVRHRLAEALAKTFDKRLSDTAFNLLLEARVSSMNRVNPGMRREIVNGVAAIQSAAGPANMTAILDIPFALVFVGTLYILSWQIATVVLLFIALVAIYAGINQNGMNKPIRGMQVALSQRNVLLAVAVNAAETIRAYNAKGFMRKKWGEGTDAHDQAQLAVIRAQANAQSVTQSAQALMSAVVIAFGALLVVMGDIDVGVMMGCNILAARALMPLSRLAQMGQAFARAAQAAQMIGEAARLPREKTEGSALRAYKGDLELRDLAFGYPGQTSPLFESLSLRLEPGAVLAVAGSNGVGKTTLARLMVGLIEPVRGQILAGGVDLQQLASEWWRTQVIYMPQEPRFLDATLRDNILAFNTDLDDAGVQAVLTAVGLKKFVDESPDGADMMLNNNGETLSLGIRRRLALARALSFGGKIAILDEPTESLDAEGCQAVYALLNGMKSRGCTIVAFSHDPNIVKGASMVLDLNAKPTPRLLRVAEAAEGGGA